MLATGRPESGRNRRIAERVRLGIDVMLTLKVGNNQWHETDAQIVDLSHSGVLVRCDRVPRNARRVTVSFTWAKYGDCKAIGTLARIDETGGFAARFDRVNWVMQDFLGLYSVLGPSQRRDLAILLSKRIVSVE